MIPRGPAPWREGLERRLGSPIIGVMGEAGASWRLLRRGRGGITQWLRRAGRGRS